MAFVSTINILGSGMTAQQLRLDIISENVTNTLNAVTLAEYAWLAAMASATSFTRSTLGRAEKGDGGAIFADVFRAAIDNVRQAEDEKVKKQYPSSLASGSEGSYFSLKSVVSSQMSTTCTPPVAC